jgi:hypothetical protein
MRGSMLDCVVMKISVALLLLIAPLTLSAQDSDILTVGGKARFHMLDAISPVAILGSAAGAGIGQWRNEPREWRLGAQGYGKRLASNQGYLVLQDIVAFGLDSTLHIDPRYHRSDSTRFWPRVRNGIAQTFIARTDNNHRTFNWPGIGGNLAAGQISNVWYPHSANTVGDGLERGGIGIGYTALSNLVHEFWPDVKRKLRH